MKRRRRWRLDRDGPGRFRRKIAEMLLSDLGIVVDAADIHCNNSPSDRWEDMCRWCAGGRDANGLKMHVCSWDRMGDIIRAGNIAIVEQTPGHAEVSYGPGTQA